METLLNKSYVRVILSAVLAVVSSLGKSLFNLFFGDPKSFDWGIAELQWGCVFAFFVFLLSELYSEIKNKEKHDSYLIADSFYQWLLDSHRQLPRNITPHLEERLESENDKKGGIVFINIGDDKYLDYLKSCFYSANKSFKCILTEPYNIDWFYNNTDLPLNIKKGYLWFTNNAKNDIISKENRIRMIVSSKRRLKSATQKLIDNNCIDNFFINHQNFTLLFLDTGVLKHNYYDDFRKIIENAIAKDFAMFDDSIILRKTCKHELAYYINEKNSFISLFDNIYTHDIYDSLIKPINNKTDLLNIIQI